MKERTNWNFQCTLQPSSARGRWLLSVYKGINDDDEGSLDRPPGKAVCVAVASLSLSQSPLLLPTERMLQTAATAAEALLAFCV